MHQSSRVGTEACPPYPAIAVLQFQAGLVVKTWLLCLLRNGE